MNSFIDNIYYSFNLILHNVMFSSVLIIYLFFFIFLYYLIFSLFCFSFSNFSACLFQLVAKATFLFFDFTFFI